MAAQESFLDISAEEVIANATGRALASTSKGPPAVSPPSFGDEEFEDIGIFLKTFVTVTNAQGWDDILKISRLPLYLKGRALAWFHRQKNLPTKWTDFENQLRKAFQPPGYLETK